MPTVSSGILFDANTFNLKEIRESEIRPEVEDFYVPGEITVQAFQTLRELLFNEDKDKLERMLKDFGFYNAKGVEAAKKFFEAEGLTRDRLADYTAGQVFDGIAGYL